MTSAKKLVVAVAVIGAVFSFNTAKAEENAQVPPVSDLWKMILDLKQTIVNLQSQMTTDAATASANSQKGLIGINYKKDMSFARIGTTDFTSVPERTVWYEKHSPDSVIRVTYDDSFGVTFKERGDCRWRLTVDGEATGKEKSFAPATAGGNVFITDRTSSSVSWIVEGLPHGFYNFTIQAKRSMANAYTTRCDNGWQDGNQENSLTVEEIVK